MVKKNKKLTIILECDDDGVAGRVFHRNFTLVAIGKTITEVRTEIKTLIADYIKHEGQKNSWKYIKFRNITFESRYDLFVLLKDCNYISKAKLAEKSGVPYHKIVGFAKQTKFSTRTEMEKIYKALVSIGNELVSYKRRLYVPKKKLK